MKSKTLLIDLDGTLLGAHPIRLHFLFIVNFVRALRSRGFSIWESLKILHLLKLSMRNATHQKNGITNWEKSINFFSQLSKLSIEESKTLLTDTSIHCFIKASPALFSVNEAKDFVMWAKNHYHLILATNPLWPLAVVEYRLGIAEIEKENFEFITHAGNMSSCKPHVEYYQELSEKLKLNSSECLMIGNDQKKDGPAKQIGIDVVIINKPADFKNLQQMLQKESAD